MHNKQSRICPLCGRQVDITINGLCPQCYANKYGIVTLPDILVFDICRYCGSVRVGRKWIQVSSFKEAIESVLFYVISKRSKNNIFNDIKINIIEYRTSPNWKTRAIITINAKYNDIKVTQKETVTVQFKPTVCPVCKIRVSGEYDTLLQIRGRINSNIINNIFNEINKLKIQNQFIDIIENKNGIDVYFTNVGAARKLAKKLAKIYSGKIDRIQYENVTITRTGSHRSRKTLLLKLKGRHEK